MQMDEDLLSIQRIQRGDESGLSELMLRHRQAVFYFSIRYTGNEADAAELTEETFFRVYQNAKKFSPKAKVKTWIFTIAANLSRDFLRRQKKHHALTSIAADDNWLENTLSDEHANPEEEAVSGESVREIEAAIAELPHKLKFPFIFCVLEQHSYEECASVLNTSKKTVETRIYRARNLLREKLSDYRDEP